MRLFNKFLVIRRDGSVPEWPYLVMGARDPAVPPALRAYADAAHGMDEEYLSDIRALADSFEQYRMIHGPGDPDAPPHRPDDPEVVRMIRGGSVPRDWSGNTA